LKNLAYRIEKNRKAHYSLMNIEAPHEAIHEIERQMRLNEDVLRYLTVRVDDLEDGPSVQMQKKERDERRRRERERRRDEEES
jgi:small subunit ribosomal protein S6